MLVRVSVARTESSVRNVVLMVSVLNVRSVRSMVSVPSVRVVRHSEVDLNVTMVFIRTASSRLIVSNTRIRPSRFVSINTLPTQVFVPVVKQMISFKQV